MLEDYRLVLKNKIDENKKLFGAVVGSGLNAKQAISSGADLLFLFNAAIYRQMGRSSLCAFLPYENANHMVVEKGKREIIPLIPNSPLIIGLCAADPTINIENTLKLVKNENFFGVCNFPTSGFFDGDFGELLEREGNNGYIYDVEMMRIAKSLGLFTAAFVFNEEHAQQMINVGVDAIGIHLGLTQGGSLGAKKVISLEKSQKLINSILSIEYDGLTLFYGGCVQTPRDMDYIYSTTKVEGYIAGSTFDRIPIERQLSKTIKAFIHFDENENEQLLSKMLDGINEYYDPVSFIKEYIRVNYMDEITLKDIAHVAHISRSYLSTLFKNEVGESFSDYLIKYRLNKAHKFLSDTTLPIADIAQMVGYREYSHFSKSFKLYFGKSPSQYRKSNKNT